MVAKSKNLSGFTLIEILIVIAVSSILSLSVFTVFQNTSLQSRDTERQADIDELAAQLEVYRQQKGIYPLLANINTTSMPGLSVDALRAPRQTSSSVVATATPATTQYGLISYLPNGTACTSGATCGAKYKLFWYQESTNTVQSKGSLY